jgi:hypothetical protein
MAHLNARHESESEESVSHPNSKEEYNCCEHGGCSELAEPRYDYCDKHIEHYFCECGQPLEDAYGQPGDGFCVRCR